MLEIWALFISSFLASTLLPGGSEAALVLAAYNEIAPPVQLLIVATLGNTLGGMTSWGIGWWLRHKFPMQSLRNSRQQKSIQYMSRFGSPVLLFSWLPIIGDPLCVAAGWLKIHWFYALVFIALGKSIRYSVILFLMG